LSSPASQFQPKTLMDISTPLLDSLDDGERSYSRKSLQPRGLRPRTHQPSYAKTKNPFVFESDSDSDEDGDMSDHYNVALMAYRALSLPLSVPLSSTPSVGSIYIPKSNPFHRSQSLQN
jgi:hypothetical protein